MKKNLLLCALSLGVIICSGCRSIDPSNYPVAKKPAKFERNEAWHTVRVEAKEGVHVTTLDKANPVFWFGNIDDPNPPDWYLPGNSLRRPMWLHVRNPAHNFMFYVIGVADKDVARSGRYPEVVFNPYGGWNNCVTAKGRMRLPILSYQRGWFYFYFGWRERGNFGIKFTITKPKVVSK